MSHPLEITVADVRWRVSPEYRDLLLGPHGLRLDDWLRGGQAQVVKHNGHRTVYRVRLPGLDFYLKHNRPADTKARLREWVRPAKARAEYERALAVAARRVPTVVPLAVGESTDGGPGDSFLLTRTLDSAQPLSLFLEKLLPALPGPRHSRLRQRVAVALGQFLARMHDAGVVHHDLHVGNLLIELDEGDQPRLYLIDLHAVRLGPPPGWRASRDNLVILNRWFILRAARADRLRFWHAYRSARERLSPRRLSGRVGELERYTARSNVAFWRSLDCRCRENNRRFRRVRSAVAAGHAVTDIDAAALDALLTDPDAPFRQPGAKLLKDSRSSTVAEIELPVGGTVQRVIYKRFRTTSWHDPWAALFRTTAALRSWVNGHGLRLRWLPTPRPLAVFHRKRHGLSHEGYLLTARLPDAEDLHALMRRLEALPFAERRRTLCDVIDQAARLVREMHRRQVSHRDLKAVNVLVTRGPADGANAEPLDHWPLTESRIWLIDLVGVTRHRRLGRRRKVRNLARLHASFCRHPLLTRADKLRFLRTYLQGNPRGEEGWKDWWRQVERATRAKVARNARTGRPLA